MKLFLMTKRVGLEKFLEAVTQNDFAVVKVSSEAELFKHDIEKCVLVIDIDSFKDHGFALATKLSNFPQRRSLIVGIASWDVDSADSGFDLFFDSFEAVKENLQMIMEEYEKL